MRLMRAVCQRVARARVVVDGETVAEIGQGLLVLVGVARDDVAPAAERLARKVARLRIFEDADGKFARSLLDVGGAALVVSQFTLITDSRRQRGARPDFSAAAPREKAEPEHERFSEALAREGVPVECGIFGAYMQVELVNDGPVTIVLDT
jgi:D-aminoacyl-tRNA deacylase